MVNKTVITFGIFTLAQANRLAPRGVLANPTFGGSFAHGAPRRDLSRRVGKLANLGPNAATCANVSDACDQRAGPCPDSADLNTVP